jgi:heat shock protein HslJ
MNRFVAPGIIAVLALCGSACSENSGSAGPSTASRLEGNWALVAFEPAAGPVEPVSDSQAYTLEFTSDGQLGMRADCNRCTSSYEAHGLYLSVGGLACTRVACPPESKSTAFINAVSGASSYQRNDESLFLYYEGGRLRLRGN